MIQELELKLKEKTAEMMNTCTKQSHKRTRLMLEMQQIFREIKKINNN